MKKLLSLLFSILLVSSLVFSVTSCKKGEEGSQSRGDDRLYPAAGW